MKIKNILLAGVAALALVSCNDFLEVEAPSAYTEELVFTEKSQIERALNGVYAQALVNDFYGNAYQRTFILNSDVDFQVSSDNNHSHTSYARLDCDDQGGEIYKFWTAAYSLIEYANKFVRSAETSEIYDTEDSELMQWIGEVKCLRAMAYHDLVVMFGDVPFTFEPAAEHGNNFVIPVADRTTIQAALIEDLQKAAPYMLSTIVPTVTVEHCSKEFAHALIARIALTAGGYSLRPDKDNARNYGTMERPENYREFYQIAMDHADSVIMAGTHKLNKGYQDVFVDECNYIVTNDDDPIFEIPFAKESTGNTGYIQGPTYSDYEGKTVGEWGKCDGGVRLNAFYRFLFRDNDKRREFINGLWYYGYKTASDGTLKDTIYIRNDYSVHNNKWSKLWTAKSMALGNDKTGNTGINYPYMRYADVLLMYAEAANEINGAPTDKAIDCLKQVHDRAFGIGVDDVFITEAQAGKDEFQKAVLDERKWEFAGENSRWRDLVRTNTYAEELIYSFLRYYAQGMRDVGGETGYEDAINNHDGKNYITRIPRTIHYHLYYIEEANELAKFLRKDQLYGYVIDNARNITQMYPNQSMQSLRIFNAYATADQPGSAEISDYFTNARIPEKSWARANFYRWGNEDAGTPNDQCKYSFYGYVRSDARGNLWVINNGAQTQLPSTIPTSSELPAVRYLLPYPNLAIQRSAGAYKNYYGY